MNVRQLFGIDGHNGWDVLVAPSVCIEETKIGPINSGLSKTPVSLKRRVSGTSLNIALALTNVFEKTVKLLGCVSENPNEPHNAYLQSHVSGLGIDFHPLPVYDDTSVSTLIIDSEGKDEGGNLTLSTKGTLIKTDEATEDLKKQVSLCQPQIVIASGVTDKDLPLVHALFEAKSSFRILNPRPELIKNIPLKTIKGIDLLIINHEELALCMGKGMKEGDIRREDVLFLHEIGIPFVIVTLNLHGMIFSGADINSRREAITLGKPVSSTGTGDAFTSAFVAAVLNGLDLEECLLWARVFAGLKVTKPGGSNLPTYEEFQNGLKSVT